ncbi:hydroxymethylcytosylglucuronate/cytosylglucuronate synthase [Saccharopolyspora sp. HNM0986]|uniref:hydroxymethylcytosylglucuronate/cytosylglucurona te synthase n=1 Tax=Saccharopolyspora galaxeae TaxID=2781241 RepID=UPI00190A00AB|nr:hydroxymethylcytosylglucuronate/cytosylglucuronate synthase [Saccharopolyspora sp. HNM0986]MBK0868990.1 hydroxymethylcytosylglucuronate/cytosylglucuronate synthase [Saccharopolyspora sp. HNM0986]
MNAESVVTVAVVGVEFGWGSAGLLDTLVRRIREKTTRPMRFVGMSSGLGRPLLRDSGIERWYELSEDDPKSYAEVARAEGISAALSVLDAPAAKALEAVGVPTVFVDALPFLWTSGDTDWLPADVSVYCAQRCPELPEEARELFTRVEGLHWVGAVVPDGSLGSATPVESAEAGRALVVLGGLRSPQLDDVTIYPRLVVPPVLRALRSHGFDSVHVCGNLPDELVKQFADLHGQGLRVTAGPFGRGEFGRALRQSEMVLTQPGLMTLLEAGTAGAPLVRLPPQNVAGIFQARFHRDTVADGIGVPWPEFVVSEFAAVAARADGELAANEVVYGGIARGLDHLDEVHRLLVERTEDAISQTRRTPPDAWPGLVRAVGTDGADEVAEHLFKLIDRGGKT